MTCPDDAWRSKPDELTKVYGSGNTEVVAMRDVTMSVRRGEVVALLGPSGAGKSTFLTAVGLINPPTSGQISSAAGRCWTVPPPWSTLRAFRRKHIGYVFQKSNLIPFLSAVENVQVALELNGLSAPRPHAAARWNCSTNWAWPTGGAQARRCSPAASSSGWRWRAPGQRPQRDPGRRADRRAGQPPRPAGDGALRRVAHEHGAGVIVVTHDHRARHLRHDLRDGGRIQVFASPLNAGWRR
jgi:putative ABC transport system ATP-binding protein